MKAVILAAGEGKRMKPLTETRPKPMLPVAGKPLLWYHYKKLKELDIDEIYAVVGYHAEVIQRYFGDELKYRVQKNQRGTGDALRTVRNDIDDEFLLIYGDTYFTDNLKLLVEKHKPTICGYKVNDVSNFGKLIVENGKLKEVKEKSESGEGLAFTGIALLTTEIFERLDKIQESKRGEIELTDALYDLDIYELDGFWSDVAYPWDLLKVNEIQLKEMKKSEIKGGVEELCTIKNPVHIGEGSVIKAYSYITGPVYIGKNCEIGPFAYIRPYTSIGDGVHIGSREIKNCIIMNYSKLLHHGYIGDSIIGEEINLGAGTTTANLRHDGKNVKYMIDNMLADTGRRKFGATIGDRVHTGINTSIYEGRIIWPEKTTLPGEVVRKNIK